MAPPGYENALELKGETYCLRRETSRAHSFGRYPTIALGDLAKNSPPAPPGHFQWQWPGTDLKGLGPGLPQRQPPPRGGPPAHWLTGMLAIAIGMSSGHGHSAAHAPRRGPSGPRAWGILRG